MIIYDRPYYFMVILPFLALIFIFVTSVGRGHAAAVSKSKATAVAETYAKLGLAESAPDVYAVGADPWLDNGDTIAYIVHLSNGGDCVAGAEDVLLPVILYNSHDVIDPEYPGHRYFLVEMAARLKWLKEQQRAGTLSEKVLEQLEDRRKLWEEMAAGNVRPGVRESEKLAAPETMCLRLNARWDQYSLYNNECPIGEDSEGSCRTVVGCAPLAVAQILFYWKWPNWPYSIPSYFWDGDQSCQGHSTDGQTLSVPSNTVYDWANMVDFCGGEEHPCSETNREAMAKLCYEVAVALQTDFGCCGSTAQPVRIPGVLKDYFKYNFDATEHFTHPFTPDVLVNEIQFLRPVCYGGINSEGGGHGWVVYGYDKTSSPWSFACNLGWGNTGDWWYTLDEIGFPILQRYTFQIAPIGYMFAGADDAGDGSPDDPWLGIVEALAEMPPSGYELILKAGSVHDMASPLIMGGKDFVIKGEAVVIK